MLFSAPKPFTCSSLHQKPCSFLAMVPCFSSFFATLSANQSPNLADDESIVLEKRKSNLCSTYSNNNPFNEHRRALEDWICQYEISKRMLAHKQENCRSAHSDLYRLLGLFFIFQGVIIIAVTQDSLLTCQTWFLPVFLCLLTSISAFHTSVRKLKEIAECTGQMCVERAHYISLHKSIEKLKEQGTSFNICEEQSELRGPYTEKELSGKGSFAQFHSSISRFCRMWIMSYAGALLLLLLAFSGTTLFFIYAIVCDPGEQKST